MSRWRTAVISQRGMAVVLGLGQSGSRIPDFIKTKTIGPYVGRELGEKFENPLVFQAPTLGANQPPTKTYGYDITILIDLCKAVLKAEEDGRLLRRQAHIARQAQRLKIQTETLPQLRGII